MITDAGNGPVYAVGGIEVLEEKAKAGVLRALMLIKADDQATWILTNKRKITLNEVLAKLPPEMVQYGTIAGLQLEGEGNPTSIVIYSGLDMEDLRQLTYARLYTSQLSRGAYQEYLKKCREQAYVQEQMLKDPVPVVSLQRHSDQN
jgi:hypothetical protein